MYSAFQPCDTSDTTFDNLFYYTPAQKRSIFGLDNKASVADQHDDSDLSVVLNDAVSISQLDSSPNNRLCLSELRATVMPDEDQMHFPYHKNINVGSNQSFDLQNHELQSTFSLPAQLDHELRRNDSPGSNTPLWMNMNPKAQNVENFALEKTTETCYERESSAEPKSLSVACQDGNWDTTGLTLESLNESVNTIPSFETFLLTRNNHDEPFVSATSRNEDNAIFHNLGSSGNSSIVNTNSSSSCSSSSGANCLPPEAEMDSMLETNSQYFELEMNRGSHSGDCNNVNGQPNTRKDVYQLTMEDIPKSIEDADMIGSSRNTRRGLLMPDNVICKTLFADHCQSGVEQHPPSKPISNEDPLEWCSSRQGMHAHARHHEVGYTAQQQKKVGTSRQDRFDNLSLTGTEGKMKCYDPPTPEMGRKYLERRCNSLSGGGEYRVRKGSGSKPQQKGDTVTLKQPSFAEGHEEIGTFGFINFRKPGAWTRLKPGEDEDNRKRRVDAQRR